MPKVLISDKLSPAAVDIFKERGVEADVKTGLSKDELIAIIGEYDGLAIRSATKVTADVLKAAKKLKVVGRAGIGVDNVDIPAATAAGVIVMNTPFGNSITTAEHAIALMMALARDIPAANASTQAGKWEKNRFMGVEALRQDAGPDRRRQYRLHRRRPRQGPEDEGRRLRSLSVAGTRRRSRHREGRTERSAGARRFHHPAHAADQRDAQHHLGRRHQQDEEGRAHHQLRARRAGRRGGAEGGARFRPCWPARRSTCSRRNRPSRTSCSATRRSSPRRIWAPPPRKRRRTWRCRWPSRFPITC